MALSEVVQADKCTAIVVAQFTHQSRVANGRGLQVRWSGIEHREADSVNTDAPLATLIGGTAYVVSRLVLQTIRDLPVSPGGFGPSYLTGQVNNAPVGIWTAFEGLWLLPILAGFVLVGSHLLPAVPVAVLVLYRSEGLDPLHETAAEILVG